MTDRALPTKGHASRVMPPVGPEMDALVAEALGYSDRKVAAGVPPFSGYSAAAMRALEAWREQHPDQQWVVGYSGDRSRPYHCNIDGVSVLAPTLEAAICEAIIRAHWVLEDAK